MKKEQKMIEDDIEHRWGLLTDDDIKARAVCGCRAIIERNNSGGYYVAFIHNRISQRGTESDLKKIWKFIDRAKTSRAINKFISQVGMESNQVLTLTSPHGFVLKATPNSSYGYLYIKVIWNNPTL